MTETVCYAARGSDGSLTLFRGERPTEYAVEPVGPGGTQGVAWRAGPGCVFVATVPRELFNLVRCGQCRRIGVVA